MEIFDFAKASVGLNLKVQLQCVFNEVSTQGRGVYLSLMEEEGCVSTRHFAGRRGNEAGLPADSPRPRPPVRANGLGLSY